MGRNDLIKLLIIANTLLMFYWGYDILFKSTIYSYPVFMGNGMDRMILWKREEIPAPIPKFIKKHKKILDFWKNLIDITKEIYNGYRIKKAI